MKKVCALLLCVLLLASMIGCGTEVPSASLPEGSPSSSEVLFEVPPPENSEYEEDEPDPAPKNPELVDFAAKTAAGLMDGSENICYSPLSLYMALALASAGAEGETLDELMAALEREDADVEALAADMAAIMEHLPFETGTKPEDADSSLSAPEDPYIAGEETYRALAIANSIWVDDAYPLAESYQSLAENSFGAEASMVPDFGNETAAAISKWVNINTNGLLSPQYQFDATTIMALVNTVYLSASWYDSFSEEGNTEGPFHPASGADVDCTYMNRTDAHGSYIKGDNYKGISLDLNGGDESWGQMTFILPDDGVKPANLLESETLQGILSDPETTPGNITLKLPKFKFGNTLDSDAFGPLLAGMGVSKALDPNQAQFAPMLAQGDDQSPLYISDIQQDTQIAIDENGVEAAAATMMAMETTAALETLEKVELIFDRPFLFTISYDGVPLFVGTVADPAAE